jgi:hypothetical protein
MEDISDVVYDENDDKDIPIIDRGNEQEEANEVDEEEALDKEFDDSEEESDDEKEFVTGKMFGGTTANLQREEGDHSLLIMFLLPSPPLSAFYIRFPPMPNDALTDIL